MTATPTQTVTASTTQTATASTTQTATRTPSVTATSTPTATSATATATHTPSATTTSTRTPSRSASSSPSRSGTGSTSSTLSSSVSPTPTATATASVSATPFPTRSATASATQRETWWCLVGGAQLPISLTCPDNGVISAVADAFYGKGIGCSGTYLHQGACRRIDTYNLRAGCMGLASCPYNPSGSLGSCSLADNDRPRMRVGAAWRCTAPPPLARRRLQGDVSVPFTDGASVPVGDVPSPTPAWGPIGHGLTFALQRASPQALGGGGDGLGYAGIAPSVGLRFDSSRGGVVAPTFGFVVGGTVPDESGEESGAGGALHWLPDMPWWRSNGYTVNVTYAGGLLHVAIAPVEDAGAARAFSRPLDLAAALGCPDALDCAAFMGFTAATGGLAGGTAAGSATHRVLGFSVANGVGTPSNSATPSGTASVTRSATATPPVTPSASGTPSPTGTPSSSSSSTPTATSTRSVTPTGTRSPTASRSRSASPSWSPTPSRTPTHLPGVLVPSASASPAPLALAATAGGGAYNWRADAGLVSLAAAPDADCQWDAGSVQVAWEPFTDAGSGIAAVAFCLGTAPYDCDLLDWVQAASPKSHVDYANLTGLALPSGALYATVAAVNHVGLVSMAASDGLLVEARAPRFERVVDTGKYLLHPEAAFGAGTLVYRAPVDINCDAEGAGVGASWPDVSAYPGVDFFEWAVGSAPGARDVLPWTSVGTATAVYNASLAVPAGSTFFVTVRATALNGLRAEASSNGVRVMTGAQVWDAAVCLPPAARRGISW